MGVLLAILAVFLWIVAFLGNLGLIAWASGINDKTHHILRVEAMGSSIVGFIVLGALLLAGFIATLEEFDAW